MQAHSWSISSCRGQTYPFLAHSHRTVWAMGLILSPTTSSQSPVILHISLHANNAARGGMLHSCIAGILIIITPINRSVQAHMLPLQSMIKSWIKGALFPQIQRDCGSGWILGYTKPKMHQSGYKELNKSDPKGGGRLNKIHSKGKQISSIVDIIPLNPFKSQECQQQESK